MLVTDLKANNWVHYAGYNRQILAINSMDKTVTLSKHSSTGVHYGYEAAKIISILGIPLESDTLRFAYFQLDKKGLFFKMLLPWGEGCDFAIPAKFPFKDDKVPVILLRDTSTRKKFEVPMGTIKYVHELQNLYYELSHGIELNIKL